MLLEFLLQVIGKSLSQRQSLSILLHTLSLSLTQTHPLFQLEITTRHNATGLKEIALEYILRNLNDANVVEGLNDLKSEPDLLVEIITRSSNSQMASMWAVAEDGPGGSEWSER